MALHPKYLKVGDVFYERGFGDMLKMVVVEEVSHEDGQWRWAAEDINGERVNYLLTDGYEHYGPKIYREHEIYWRE